LAAKTEHLKEKLTKLAGEMEKLKAYEAEMVASPDQQISLTDPDARSMATRGRGSGVVGYNVQVAVGTEHHLIIAHEVTNRGSDRSQLANMGRQAKAALGVDELEAVADRGYYNSPEILACHEAGVVVTLPKPMTPGAKADGRFGNRTSFILPLKMSIAARLARSLSIASPASSTAWTCGATGRPRAAGARSSIYAHRRRADVSAGGSTRTFSKPCSSPSTPTHRPCASGAKRSSIPSAR
jgi:hypothetical protein